MFLVNFQSVNWHPTAVYNSFMSDNPVREDVEGKSRRRTETEVHLFFLINVSPTQIVFIILFFHRSNPVISDFTVTLKHRCSAEMLLNPELHFLSCSNKGEKKEKVITFLTQLCFASFCSSSVIRAGLLLLVSGFVMWLGCYLLTHKASERNLAAGNGEGEMKAVPHG